jgi:hypothetical protein
MIKSMFNFHDDAERIVVANKFWGKTLLATVAAEKPLDKTLSSHNRLSLKTSCDLAQYVILPLNAWLPSR